MKESLPFLYHILDEIQYILDKTGSLTVDDIRLDPDLSRSIPRSLEIIGEAVKNLSPAFRDAHPDVPWNAIAGMRDKLIHGYFGIDADIIWKTVNNDLPEILPVISSLCDKYKDN